MLITKKELKNKKLESLKKKQLKKLAASFNMKKSGNASDLIERLIDKVKMDNLDDFIRKEYSKIIKRRRKEVISDEKLKNELKKVNHFKWGVVQGRLDSKVQREYVRKFVKYDSLVNKVEKKLHNDMTSYVIATWYNHWTTKLIEDQPVEPLEDILISTP